MSAAPAAPASSWRAPLVLFVVALVATLVEASASHVFGAHFAGFMIDFRAFYCGGAALNAGADPYLAEPLRGCEIAAYGAFPAGYPDVAVPAPLPGYALVPFALLAHLPYAAAATLWFAGIALALAGSVVLLQRLSALPAGVVWAALLLSVGLVSAFLGQLVPVSLLALVLCAQFVERDRPGAAACAAALAMLEPHFGAAVCLGLALWVPRARLPLALLAASGTALSFVALGAARNLEYVRAVLPAHLASEVTNEEQYSLTHLLSLAGAPDAFALQAGTISYLIAIGVGALLAGRLVARGAPRSLLVLLPAAFAPIGGSFVHLQQMAFALPALLVLLGRVAPRDVLLGTALLLLALPLGNFTFLYVTAPFALVTAGIIAREQLRLGWLATVAVVSTTLGAIVALTFALASRPDAHAAVSAVAGDGELAEATWAALIRTSYHANVAVFTLSKLPTYAGLALFAIVTARLALGKRDSPPLVENSMPNVRAVTTGLLIVLLGLPIQAQAGQVVVRTPQNSSVDGFAPNDDATPSPPAPKPKPAAKKKPAASKQTASAGNDSHQPLELEGDGTTALGAAVVRNALRYVGVPYVWGGASPRGFDCSGFTWYVYQLAGINIPRTADVQFALGRPVAGDPMPGDLLFFQTYDYGASHVAIYLGNGQFVNSIGDDVHVASFDSAYFRSRYLGARRFLPDY